MEKREIASLETPESRVRMSYEAPRLRRLGKLRDAVRAAGAATNLDGAFFNS
ncbi:MAG TPA: hypothetical protein VGN26_01600 [Armatimonadota bacterium]|jgi:hypothetical protein